MEQYSYYGISMLYIVSINYIYSLGTFLKYDGLSDTLMINKIGAPFNIRNESQFKRPLIFFQTFKILS